MSILLPWQHGVPHEARNYCNFTMHCPILHKFHSCYKGCSFNISKVWWSVLCCLQSKRHLFMILTLFITNIFFLISLFFLFSVPCPFVVHCHNCNCIMKANDFVTFAVSGLSSRCSNLIDCCSNQETNNGQSPLSQGPNKEEDNMSLCSRFKDDGASISLGKQSQFSYGRCLKFLSHTINVIVMEVY